MVRQRFFNSKYYPSNSTGKTIVNAMTGEKYDIRVGSVDSLRLFKVIDTSGHFNSDGTKNNMADRFTNIDKEPNFLYYDNPAEYLQHRGDSRNPAISDRWRDYQKQIIDKNNNVDITVYNRTNGKRVDIMTG